MGLWSKITSACKSVANKVKEAVKSTVNAVKEVGTKMWNKFSGKDTFEEADRLYEQITERYNRKRSQFDQEMNRVIDQIEASVASINKSKQVIQAELFVQMAKQLAKIRDIKLPAGFTLEEYKASVLTTDAIRSKEKLYRIDFNKHQFKTTVQAIFTLGFYTRKKAKETLLAVQEEEAKINNEIHKMDAELLKMRTVLTSLQNVEQYFTRLISLYGQLLVRLDHSVHHLYFRCMQFAHKVIDANLSIGWLPKAQQQEIEALMTVSKILKTMTQAQIVSIEKPATQSYESDIKAGFEQFEAIYQAA